MHIVRSLFASLVVLGATIALAACSPQQPPAQTPAPRASPSPFRRVLFPGHSIVAYYGEADVPNMGILGSASPQHMLPKLLAQTREYGTYGEPVMPAFELIAVVAQRAPGSANAYSAPIDAPTVQRYLDAIRTVHGLLILDINLGARRFCHT